MLQARCLTDGNMNILEATSNSADLLQTKVEALIGKNIYDITHPDDLPSNRRLLDTLRRQGRPFAITKRYVRADGRCVWVKNQVSIFVTDRTLVRIEANVEPLPNTEPAALNPELRIVAQGILKRRSIRSGFFGDAMFGEPDFDILLDLFVNQAAGRIVSVTSACLATAVPMSTALRYIASLTERGWIERISDPRDKRRSHVLLTHDAVDRINRYLTACARAESGCKQPQ